MRFYYTQYFYELQIHEIQDTNVTVGQQSWLATRYTFTSLCQFKVAAINKRLMCVSYTHSHTPTPAHFVCVCVCAVANSKYLG